MNFKAPRSLEKDLARQLRRVHKEIMRIVSGDVEIRYVAQALTDYGDRLAPWAEDVMLRIVEKSNRHNMKVWRSLSKAISAEIKTIYVDSAVSVAMRDLSIEGAHLIQSLPYEAAQEVVDVTKAAAIEGIREEALQELVYHKGEITLARAELIARTEVARQQSLLTQTRAVSVGSTGYIWRTADDGRVRPMHAALDGKFILWNSPPECDSGHWAHAGQIFNCRCYPEPVFGEAAL